MQSQTWRASDMTLKSVQPEGGSQGTAWNRMESNPSAVKSTSIKRKKKLTYWTKPVLGRWFTWESVLVTQAWYSLDFQHPQKQASMAVIRACNSRTGMGIRGRKIPRIWWPPLLSNQRTPGLMKDFFSKNKMVTQCWRHPIPLKHKSTVTHTQKPHR